MNALKFMNEQMNSLGIPYEFGEWTSEVKYPYFVGEITEPESETEDGKEECSFVLTGFARGKERYFALEEIKNKIKKHFHPVNGLRTSKDGCSIAAFYGGAFYVQTGEADLNRIQITINIKLWEGDM